MYKYVLFLIDSAEGVGAYECGVEGVLKLSVAGPLKDQVVLSSLQPQYSNP